jgi:hypothetical protein
MYSSSDEEEALLFLVLEDEENSRFVFLSDRCRSYIVTPRDRKKLFFQEEEKEAGPRTQCRG